MAGKACDVLERRSEGLRLAASALRDRQLRIGRWRSWTPAICQQRTAATDHL